jgi:enamine deaminase RidA (YjgF/YER057c/UK114 family)
MLFKKSLIFLATVSLAMSTMVCQDTRNVKSSQNKIEKQILLCPALNPSSHPYSAGVKVGNMVFLSGVLDTEINSNKFVSSDVTGQTCQCLNKLRIVLNQAGMDLSDAVSVIVFLADLGDYDEMNKAYIAFFPKDPPARACIQAGSLL